GIRHRQIEEAGVRILRFRNEKVDTDLEGVLEEIAAVCASRNLPPRLHPMAAGSWPEAASVPPLHPMERGPGGEAGRSVPNLSSSPSPSDGEGVGGEAIRAASHPSFSPSPLPERGPGGEVRWQPLKNLRPGDWITTELGLCSRIVSIDHLLTNETAFDLTIQDDHSYITEAGVAHNHSLTIPALLSDETLRLHEFPVARGQILLAHAGECPLP